MNPEDIQQYIDANFTVIETDGKIPIESNWQHTKFRDKPTPRMLASKTFGVKLNAEHLIIDNDQRNYKDGVNSLELLQQHLGASLFKLSRFIVQTGSGGHHFYFLKPPAIPTMHVLPIYPGLEFKTVGRQVIGAGSIHPNTEREYEVFPTSYSPSAITEAPSNLLDIIQKKTSVEIKKGLDTYEDNEFDIRRCKETLRTAPPAIQGANGDDHTFKICCMGHDYGLSVEVFLNLLQDWNQRNSPHWSEEELKTKVLNAYRYSKSGLGHKSIIVDFPDVGKTYDVPDCKISVDEQKANMAIIFKDLQKNDKGAAKQNFFNLCLIMKLAPAMHDVIWYNEFSNRIVKRKSVPWGHIEWCEGVQVIDTDYIQFKKWAMDTFHIEFPVPLVVEAFRETAYHKNFHPVRAYLDSLVWDRTPRLGRWLPVYLGAEDTPYTQAIGKKFLVAAVNRVYEPGCKFDHMLHIEGEQGIGKSTTCRVLFSPWYTDTAIDITNKDSILQMQGNWGIEFGETASFKKTETEFQKSFITRQTDTIRNPYDRVTRDYPRQQVFVSTTNQAIYSDETGNRRWWAVRVRQLDLHRLLRDRDQLWAEAYFWYKQKEALFLETPQLQRMAEIEQSSRFDEDGWAPLIKSYLRDKSKITINDIWVEPLGRTSGMLTRFDQNRISKVLTTLKWERYMDGDEKGYRRK